MSIINAKCTNCGANLKVDSSRDAAICEFCGSAYVVEKAVQNYNITNNNQINANVVNIYGESSCDFEIVAGVLKKYNGPSVDVIVPNSVYEIGYAAFSGMTSLHSVILPDSVRKIGKSAFSGCVQLTNINIPHGVEYIGSQAFSGCISLKEICFPDSINFIGYEAFDYCKSLTSIIIPDSITTVEYHDLYDRPVGVVRGCSALVDVRFPDKLLPGCFRESLWAENYKKERERDISSGICPDHKRRLSLWGKKCPVCTMHYLFRTNTL